MTLGPRALAWLMRELHLCHLRAQVEGGRRFRVKERRWHARPAAIRIANALLRSTGLGVELTAVWPEEELRRLGAAGVSARRGARRSELWIEEVAGRTLAEHLSDRSLSRADQERALRAALFALRALHARGETHADATAENVIVERGLARWIDLELCHLAGWPRARREADDLRALAVSVAAFASAERLPALLGIVEEEARARDRIAEVIELLARPGVVARAFSLAQARRRADRLAICTRLLGAR